MHQLVLGIGSPFGVDNSGWLIIDQLAKQNLPANSKLQKSDRPGLKLLDILKGYDWVIIIDAAIDNNLTSPELLHLKKEQLLVAKSISSHQIGVAEALSLGANLNKLPEKIDLFAILMNEKIALRNSEKQKFAHIIFKFINNGCWAIF